MADTVPDDDTRMITKAEAAVRLNISERTLDRLRKAGAIQAVCSGRSVRYRIRDIDAYQGHDTKTVRGTNDEA